MSGSQDCKDLFRQRLRELSEQTSTCGDEEEIHQQDKLLDVISTSGMNLQRAVRPADIRQVSEGEAELPEQQKWSPHVDQNDTDSTNIKEEQEELWVSQEEEHLQGIKEDEATKFPLTIVSVKSEDGEYDREDFAGTEAGRYIDQEKDLLPETEEKTVGFSGPGNEHCKNLKDMTVYLSGLNSVERDTNTVRKTIEHQCSQCDKTFNKKSNLTRHVRIHTGEKPYSCSECTKTFKQRSHLKGHMAHHRGEKPFSCDVCHKTFNWLYQLKKHECFASQALHLYENHTDEKIQAETGADAVDSEGPEQDRNLKPERLLQPEVEVKIEDISEPETDDSDDWKESRGHQSDLKSEENTEDRRKEGETKSYSCSVCGKTFKTKWKMAIHMESHTGQRQFSCTECGKTFNYKGNLNRHKRIHRQEKNSDSPEHGQKSNHKSSLTAQMPQQSERKLSGCSECGKMFDYEWYLNRHMMIHTGEKRFICSVCGKKFKQKSYLTLHMALHRGEKPFSCDLCRKTFNWLYQFKKHECFASQALHLYENHTDEKIQAETEADALDGEGPEQARQLKPERLLQPEVEVKIEDISEPETDDSDDWKETRGHQSDLKSEENTEDARKEGETKSYSCSVCGKMFKTKWNMATHMKNHMGQRQFSCTECGKTFNHKGNMNRHKRIHRQEKNSDSPEHGKRSNRKSSLTAQMPQQSKRKLFGCSECGKMFDYEWHLNRHMIIHTGEKRFICSVCGKRFKQKSYLTLHMALHRGEKPYSCNVCEQRFVWRSQLKNHKCVGGNALALDQNQTNAADTGCDGEDNEEEQSRKTDPETHLQPETRVTSEDFSKLENDEFLTRSIV